MPKLLHKLNRKPTRSELVSPGQSTTKPDASKKLKSATIVASKTTLLACAERQNLNVQKLRCPIVKSIDENTTHISVNAVLNMNENPECEFNYERSDDN